MSKFITTVRGHQHEWAVEVAEASVEDMRADGIEVHEIVNSIPVWAVNAELGGLWMLAQDIWDASSRLWRKWRKKP